MRRVIEPDEYSAVHDERRHTWRPHPELLEDPTEIVRGAPILINSPVDNAQPWAVRGHFREERLGIGAVRTSCPDEDDEHSGFRAL
jgi:hypothetical protein